MRGFFGIETDSLHGALVSIVMTNGWGWKDDGVHGQTAQPDKGHAQVIWSPKTIKAMVEVSIRCSMGSGGDIGDMPRHGAAAARTAVSRHVSPGCNSKADDRWKR